MLNTGSTAPLHRGGVGRIDLRGDEPLVPDLGDGLVGAGAVVVGDHAQLEEVAPSGNGGERGADATGADQEDLHP
jgi:hypothetical protein